MNEAEILVQASKDVWPIMYQWLIFIIGVLIISISAGNMVSRSFDILNEENVKQNALILILLFFAIPIGFAFMFLAF